MQNAVPANNTASWPLGAGIKPVFALALALSHEWAVVLDQIGVDIDDLPAMYIDDIYNIVTNARDEAANINIVDRTVSPSITHTSPASWKYFCDAWGVNIRLYAGMGWWLLKVETHSPCVGLRLLITEAGRPWATRHTASPTPPQWAKLFFLAEQLDNTLHFDTYEAVRSIKHVAI